MNEWLITPLFSKGIFKYQDLNKSARWEGGENQRVLSPKEETLLRVKGGAFNPKCHRHNFNQHIDLWQ